MSDKGSSQSVSGALLSDFGQKLLPKFQVSAVKQNPRPARLTLTWSRPVHHERLRPDRSSATEAVEMRLLHTSTLMLAEFVDGDVPRYAILSHTWGDSEVTLRDMEDGRAADKRAYGKIEACCSTARDRGFEYIWVDTCCIDKTSNADSCLAYLADVPSRAPFPESRWFTRGWTLQELIAPPAVIFFDEDWEELGTRESLREAVSSCTRIPLDLLSGGADIHTFSIAQKMSWAAGRQTTRVEGRAYSLLGIHNINMPLIYREKETAFIRLQEEIMKISDDHNLFAWRSPDTRGGLLATSPDPFIRSGNIIEYTPPGTIGSPLAPHGIGLGILRCRERGAGAEPIAIYLRDPLLTMTQFERVRSDEFQPINMTRLRLSQCPLRKMCIRKGRMARGEKSGDRGLGEGAALKIPPAEAHRTDDARRAALLQAVEQDHEGDKWLLLTRSDFEESLKGELGPYVLSRAVEQCHEPVINLLLARSEIDADQKDKDGRTPLLKIAEASLAVAVRQMLRSGKLLVEQGANIESKDRSGWTPLSHAVESGNEAVVQLLLEKRADVESEDRSTEGVSLLSWASGNGLIAVVRLLLLKGTDLNSQDQFQQTPLIWAALSAAEVVARLLLEKGANMEARDDSGRTSLSWAAKNGQEAVVELLLEEGADVEARDMYGRTPVLWAAEKGHKTVVKLLLEKGADVEAGDKYCQTPLSWAAEKGQEAVVKLLLEKRTDVETRDKYGQTPVSWAAKKGQEAVIKLLLGKGADVEVRDNYGRTPVLWAAEKGHKAVVELLTRWCNRLSTPAHNVSP
ncbi:ankyrin repeat-containing domain protein [Lasiosphaeris hirsuta]|uniref:Ankyrin repeat-containing domain protein n=1 Tax=Lasiosphaeris hirsuta TaxID=260670 RepID=A0AA39ZVF6_9PEZI|nr:ankyrin repeat-containing domain protein [Lasiosphaeris hirsuta]